MDVNKIVEGTDLTYLEILEIIKDSKIDEIKELCKNTREVKRLTILYYKFRYQSSVMFGVHAGEPLLSELYKIV